MEAAQEHVLVYSEETTLKKLDEAIHLDLSGMLFFYSIVVKGMQTG